MLYPHIYPYTKKKTESGNLMTFMDVYHYGFYYEIAIIRYIVYSRKRL